MFFISSSKCIHKELQNACFVLTKVLILIGYFKFKNKHFHLQGVYMNIIVDNNPLCCPKITKRKAYN